MFSGRDKKPLKGRGLNDTEKWSSLFTFFPVKRSLNLFEYSIGVYPGMDFIYFLLMSLYICFEFFLITSIKVFAKESFEKQVFRQGQHFFNFCYFSFISVSSFLLFHFK